ncbi:TonB-dependent receptor [Brevundimonas subvibrioides]|uniref:TonB-dependent receptor n=1 Tax=Brevundimonas subvibrioides TaxID=74313 RepID=UPI0022B45FD5|nr:TonB-dependent receptor [Brevundimonas subvibrioides]
MKLKTIRQRLLNTSMIGSAALLALTAVPVIALVAPTEALAQSLTGSLRVTVSGDGGAPLSGANVTVSSPDSLVSRTGVTDADGRVRLAGLDPATNYTVNVTAAGYDAFGADNVAVVAGRDLSVGYVLVSGAGPASNVDDIVVTGTSLAAIDVTSAQVSTTLTLGVVEALPTARSYQSYLQLVPGVKPSNGGNPSSRSGVNYAEAGGGIGTSTDNLYYLDGVDVTDPVTGTFGSNFNSEIIQEQQVIVGGVPAEYAGGSGLVSRVITKSGSNEWHGSLNYYFQNSDLVAEDQHITSGGFDTYDSAFTLGGPIIRDRLWIYGSYQKKNRQDDVLDVTASSPTFGQILRSVESDQDYGFAKLTWQATDNDRLTLTYFGDPTTISGQNSSAIINRRDYSREQGGDNYKVDYTRTWGDLILNGYYFKHEAQIVDQAVDQSIRDNVTYRNSFGSNIIQRSLGGRGINLEETRNREEYGSNFEYYLDTGFGSHTFKGGFSFADNTNFQTDSVPGGATYNSLASIYAGTTLASYVGSGWTARAITTQDYSTFLLPALSGNARARSILDTNADGQVSATEAGNLVFGSTAGNPYNNVNVYRTVRAADGPYTLRLEYTSLYLQDTWTLDQLTVNAGVRAERTEHFASDDSKIASFDWTYAPRLSVVYDLNGDGRSKVFGFVGRYYDPIRADMTDFAGALTGPVNNEQIYVSNGAGGEWVTFRTRGPGDAQISPATKTPYTDEFMIGGSTTIGSDIGIAASVTHRVTKDIMEDFDLTLYSDPTCTQATCGVNGAAFPGSAFYLPYSYFGYDANPGTNYVIGTLPGGKREYTGFELTVTKFKTDNWFGQASYTYNKAEGNANSDGNADFVGDWLALDPRAPNVYGPQAGNIPHQFKAYGGYEFDFGLEVSSVFNWNSGALYTPGSAISGRIIPDMQDPFVFNGVTDSYLVEGITGSEQGPSYYTWDLRFKYVADAPYVAGELEFFLDVFNVMNHQTATNVVNNRAGSGQFGYQQPNQWVAPRRAYLGVRYSF